MWLKSVARPVAKSPNCCRPVRCASHIHNGRPRTLVCTQPASTIVGEQRFAVTAHQCQRLCAGAITPNSLISGPQWRQHGITSMYCCKFDAQQRWISYRKWPGDGVISMLGNSVGTRQSHSARDKERERENEGAQEAGKPVPTKEGEMGDKSVNDKRGQIKGDVAKSLSSWHRPTKEELLAAASGFYDRLRIRFKWLLLRQVRPFNTDDISAFFSWILVGNLIWILLGTTTFFSLVILTLNTVYAQDAFAKFVGNLVTKETGLTVVFESAIVPHWRDGVISFDKVFVSRRPGSNKKVNVGSQAMAAAAAAAAAEAAKQVGIEEPGRVNDETEDDGNYTQFDLTIDTVSVTLSLRRWIEGKGILQDVEVRGVRGIVDRRHVTWNDDYVAKDHKNVYRKGDFEIENFKLEDLLVTLYQPGEGVKPFEVSIYSCDLPQLRKHWLLYDILSANHMSGSYDNSLFTIHPRQMRAFNDDKSPFKRITRLRIDNVDIKHLNRGVEGPFGWIESGNVDMLADVIFPADAEEASFSEIVQDIVERWEANVASRGRKPADQIVTSVEERSRERASHRYVVFDVRVQFNSPRAVVPLYTSDLSYVNNALIHPIVGYINSRDTYIPVNCRVVKRISDFEGSWTVYDSELMDDISAEVYESFVRNVADDEARARRIRKVGFWSLQLAAQLILLSLGIIA